MAKQRADPHRPTRYQAKDGAGRIRWPNRPRVDGVPQAGWTTNNIMSISFNDSAPEQADTLIHELMHVERYQWSEDMVEEVTAVICASIARNPGPWIWAIWALTKG